MDPSTGDIAEKLIVEAKHLPHGRDHKSEGGVLESMDGDASYVPVTWVLAVIEKLKVGCKRETWQQSICYFCSEYYEHRKSTLLNTMFGLHFNVIAGRCTRDAYIQLLPFYNLEKINCN